MKTFENKEFRLDIIQDDCPEPFDFTESDTKMICFHKRYSFGKQTLINDGDPHDYVFKNDWEKLKKEIVSKEKPGVILPIYLLDHSGLTMSTSPFPNQWDSGQVGYILMTCKKARENYGVKRVSKKLKEKISIMLKNEVETYNLYLNGEIYGFRVFSKIWDKPLEQSDDCWGFYGSNIWENGMTEQIRADVVISLYPELKKEYGENLFMEKKIKELTIV